MAGTKRTVLLGNEAIALGLIEGGCRVITAYPGTPSTEILPAAVRFSHQWDLSLYSEWSTNEKVAFDHAYASAMVGKEAACCMKQVGLNVACDSLMSAAYTGVVGGLVVVVCDDPGPHSSQTEQDSRFMARLAKVPVLDPGSPSEARRMAREALALSRKYGIPFVLRSVTRISHAREGMRVVPVEGRAHEPPRFPRDPTRWAATPRFRLLLHGELNKKLRRLSRLSERRVRSYFRQEGESLPFGIIASGLPARMAYEALLEAGRDDIPLLKVEMPFPFPVEAVRWFMSRCENLLILEETDAFIELHLPTREGVMGRMSGHVPSQGELLPEVIKGIIEGAEGAAHGGKPRRRRSASQSLLAEAIQEASLPQRRPTLCPGCPHRATFYAIRRAFPKAIYPSDIGCYTLGINQRAVDTVLDMGSGITIASGLYQAFHQDGETPTIVATMGDSTFYHAGLPSLVNAVYNDARFVLVLLDNFTTAMTGMQPTAGLGIRADGSRGRSIPLERIVAGCGVDFVEVHDPYDIKGMVSLLKRAHRHARSPNGGVAVVIARRGCILAYREEVETFGGQWTVTELCKGCRHCLEAFQCPAMQWDEGLERVAIDELLCIGCGVCAVVCPKGAVQQTGSEQP
jgi:indolepyruvate ferredoxin oxidoreductase alpha subunit